MLNQHFTMLISDLYDPVGPPLDMYKDRHLFCQWEVCGRELHSHSYNHNREYVQLARARAIELAI